MTNTIKKQIAKQKDFAFGKNVYLLGKDSEGMKYWLKAPSWNCNWYWGFGYVETYVQNWAPSKARDISCHTHIDSSFIGKHEYYDSNLKTWKQSEYIHNIYDSPKLAQTTFSESEGWQLSELFKTFYQLKDMAALLCSGSAHVTDNPVKNVIQDKEYAKRINEVMIPAVTAKIIEILSPI